MQDMKSIFRNHNKSYMMVMVLSYLDLARDYPRGVPIRELAKGFQDAMTDRERRGLPVDVPPSEVGEQWASAPISKVQSLLLGNPLTALREVLHFDRTSRLLSVRQEFSDGTGPDWATHLRAATASVLDEYWRTLGSRKLDETAPAKTDLRSKMLSIMDSYVGARNEAFKAHPMHAMMRDAVQAMESLDFIPLGVIVRGSVGQGNWANVPWIALMDTRNTSSTRDGVYVCYLFSEDMSRCYLTLNRGVTRTIEEKGRRLAYQTFRDDNVRDRAIREHADG